MCLAGELGELFFSLGKILSVLIPSILVIPIPNSEGPTGAGIPFLGSLFWVLFPWKSPRGNLGLEQELPWMSQEFWAWPSVNCHVLFVTICVKIHSFNEKNNNKTPLKI